MKPRRAPPRADVGVIGGSGLYAMDGIDGAREVRVRTPFGDPSDALMVGSLDGVRVAFLPRHGRGHRLDPTEVNARANLWALKSIGVSRVLSVSAVGSMKEEIRPRDFVIPDQIIDRTRSRPYSFFGEGIVAHVSFADPFCPALRRILLEGCRGIGVRAHDGGAYVCIEGPTFSTRAESNVFRSWGVSVIGMTAVPEAKLAREAEVCYATVALATDYDVWKEGEEVSVESVVANLVANAENVKRLVRTVVPRIFRGETRPPCACGAALEHAIMTDRKAWPRRTVDRLRPILSRFL
jgi:5'-methylthioadenosine phosphorylase